MINLDLEKHIAQQIEQTVKTYLDSEELRTKILEQVDNSIGKIIENVSNRVYAEVINRSQISEHVKTIVKLEASNAIQQESMEVVRAELSNTPVKQIIENTIRHDVDLAIKNFSFPAKSIASDAINWKTGSLNGSYLKGGIVQNFSSTGIEDKSDNVQLTILNDHVVAEGQFTAMNITAAETLTAQNLVLTGTLEIGTEIIDHGPFSQMMQMHAGMVVDDQLQPYTALLKDGISLLNENSLAPSVTNSNLRRVGNLLELTVSGDAKFSETMFVSAGNKVGINTEEPRGALSVWDEDAEISFMKTGRRTMFLGSTRDGQVEIGTSNKGQISLTEDNVTINSPLTIMGVKFSAGTGVPDSNGQPNEIRFVTSARDDQPRFYICLGGNKWKALG